MLGDPHKAEFVMVIEGESDALAAWPLLRDDDRFAVICLPGSTFVPGDLASFIGTSAIVVIATDADGAGDKCAGKAAQVLRDASVDDVRRLRPDVSGVECPDLRDLIAHLRATTTEPALLFANLAIDAPAAGIGSGALGDLGGASGGWPEPMPLEAATLPMFPTDALPESLRVMVEAIAHTYQAPPDLGAAGRLAPSRPRSSGRWRCRLGPTGRRKRVCTSSQSSGRRSPSHPSSA